MVSVLGPELGTASARRFWQRVLQPTEVMGQHIIGAFGVATWRLRLTFLFARSVFRAFACGMYLLVNPLPDAGYDTMGHAVLKA